MRLVPFASLLLACLVLVSPNLARAQEKSPFSSEQQDAIKKLVHDYLVEHPEVIMEAVQALREKEHLAAEEAAKKVLNDPKSMVYADPESPVLGNPNGDVTVVEFFDYHCPYCKAMTDGVFDIINADGKVRYVMKELPVLGPESVYAARAAIASREQNKYEELHRALMHLKGPLNEQTVMKAAADVGINTDKLKKDMESEKIDKIINDDLELAHTLNIDGTPGWVIGTEATSGAMSPQAFKQLIDQARKAKS